MAVIGQLNTILSVVAGSSLKLVPALRFCSGCGWERRDMSIIVDWQPNPEPPSPTPRGIVYVLAAAFVQKGIFGSLALVMNAITGICLSMGLLGGYIAAVGLQREMFYSGQDLGRLLTWLCGLVTGSRSRTLMPCVRVCLGGCFLLIYSFFVR